MSTEDQEIRIAAIDAAINLQTSMDNLSKDMVEVHEVNKRQKKFIKWLAMSVLFDILLSFGLGWAAIVAVDASQEAKVAASAARVAKVAEHESCLETNRVRATQIELWGEIITILGERLPHAAELRTLTVNTFQSRNCEGIAS